VTARSGAVRDGEAVSAGAREARRNFRLGVVNGALFQFGEGFIDGSTVIPVFLSRLTQSSALIGFAASLSDLGWLLPQVLVAPWVARFPRQLWLYRRAAVVRGAALALLAAAIWPLQGHPAALLAAFLACYATYCLGGGFAAVSFMEVVGRTVPRERLGSYWGQRLFWGGLLAASAGLVVRQVLKLGDERLKFGLLFSLATVFVSVGYGLFSVIREPAHPPGEPGGSPLALLREGLGRVRRDRTFRSLLVARGSLASWFTLTPFMVLFAVRDLGGGVRVAGTFLLARVAGFVISNLFWPRLSSRYGNRALMKIATLGGGVVALLAAAVAAAARPGLLPPGAAVVLLELIAALGGAMHSGVIVAYASLLIELAPPGRRQGFIGLMNTFVGPSMIVPAIGGALVDVIGTPAVFALCSLIAWAGYRAATRLPEVRGLSPEGLIEGGDVVGGGGGR
jgi:MFS family permease